MITTKNLLTATDDMAINLNDSDYINRKGAKLYTEETYAESVEYYHLAAAMGNIHAISNLGYCYLYGRDIEADLSMAVAYFKIAAKNGNADAAYKLGDIYGNDKWGVKDKELSVYYYQMAASFIIGDDWEYEDVIADSIELQNYPSLCFALGRELSHGGNMNTNLDCAYHFLKHAQAGYETELLNGRKMYQKSYENVNELMKSSQFDKIKEKYDYEF